MGQLCLGAHGGVGVTLRGRMPCRALVVDNSSHLGARSDLDAWQFHAHCPPQYSGLHGQAVSCTFFFCYIV